MTSTATTDRMDRSAGGGNGDQAPQQKQQSQDVAAKKKNLDEVDAQFLTDFADSRSAIEKQRELMHEFKKKKKTYSPIKELPKLEPEPNYIIQTRPPMWDDWRLNIFRGIKENRIKMDANRIARRKCWRSGLKYEECCSAGGLFQHRHCRVEYHDFINCSYHEREVELDKIRRDTKQHTEWYWLNIYDENGEIGKQAQWRPEESIKGMWHTMAYHMFMGQINQKISKDKQQIDAQQQERLEQLRMKQGRELEYYKEELMSDIHMDVDKAMQLNGNIDTNIYNV